MNLTPDFSTGFSEVSLTSATVNGPGAYQHTSGNLLRVYNSTMNAHLDNSGDVLQTRSGGSMTNTFAGGLTNQVGGSITIESQGTSTSASTTMNVAGDLDNAGTISLVSSTQFTNRSGVAFLDHTGGTLTNFTKPLPRPSLAVSSA